MFWASGVLSNHDCRVFLEWGHQNQHRTAHVGPSKGNMISHIFFMISQIFFFSFRKCQIIFEMLDSLQKCKIIFKEMIFTKIIFKMIFVKFGMLWSSCKAHMWQQNAHTENTQTMIVCLEIKQNQPQDRKRNFDTLSSCRKDPVACRETGAK